MDKVGKVGGSSGLFRLVKWVGGSGGLVGGSGGLVGGSGGWVRLVRWVGEMGGSGG